MAQQRLERNDLVSEMEGRIFYVPLSCFGKALFVNLCTIEALYGVKKMPRRFAEHALCNNESNNSS
jgi:hypothetical protein